ncbi:MAG: methyltransferase domain-containing protein [Acidobacteria bacterium]|nr:methyltransferase domain-containing protein [Acidobacteriota bacterium]
MRVVGVDINTAALDVAWSNAVQLGVKDRVHFEPADILEGRALGRYDLVMLIRVLTCFGDAAEWQQVLDVARDHIRDEGLLYVHDFTYSPRNENYRKRYAEGQRLGMRPGNFAVHDEDGDILFIAHHHSEEELELIRRGYDQVFYLVHESLSLHGNTCTMFEYIGRKR